MRRLPIRPAIFIAVWLALFAGAVAAMLAGPPLADVLYTPLSVALMLLQLFWTAQAARFAADFLAEHGQVQRARRLDLATTILAIAAVAGSIAFLIALPQGLATTAPTHTFLGVGVFVAALGAFALYVVAAMAISAAERIAGGGSPHVLGTFIQFVYLILAVSLLYRRLQRLAEPASSPPTRASAGLAPPAHTPP